MSSYNHCCKPFVGAKCNNKMRVVNDYARKRIVYLNPASRMMPGRQDVLQNTQKRVLLCSLNEAYIEFKTRHPGVKVGFTKFTQLRPNHCIKLGSSSQHNVCVCLIHQNMKLMIEGTINAVNSRDNSQFPFKDCKDLISFVMCGDKQMQECSITMCKVCSKNLGELKELFNWNDPIYNKSNNIENQKDFLYV